MIPLTGTSESMDIPNSTEAERQCAGECTCFRALLDARHSVRSFSPEPVKADQIDAILQTASRAPSWCNVQPWRVYILGGATLETVKREFLQAARERENRPDIPFAPGYVEPYLTRKRRADEALRVASKIASTDLKAR